MSISLYLRLFLPYGAIPRLSKSVVLFLGILASPLAAEPRTILAFGDSLTQGYGLTPEQGFVPQLQRWLTDQGAEVALINGGVSGDTTAGGLARIEWSLNPEVDAMILALGGNDMLRGIDPDVSRANLMGILEVAQKHQLEVLLIGMDAPTNYGPDYAARFNAMYPDLSEQFGTLYLRTFFSGLQDVPASDLPAYFQPDRIHPNAEGVKQVVAGIGPSVLQLVDRLNSSR